MSEQKFFRCRHCGNMVGLINNAGIPMICCNEPMGELIPNTVDAATEKHMPEVTVEEHLVHVKIGSIAHPMTEEHHIEFIYLQTENGGQRKGLKVGSDAAVVFAVLEDKPLEVFAYCNLHGLWKVTVPCDDNEQAQLEEEMPDGMICSAEFAKGCM